MGGARALHGSAASEQKSSRRSLPSRSITRASRRSRTQQSVSRAAGSLLVIRTSRRTPSVRRRERARRARAVVGGKEAASVGERCEAVVGGTAGRPSRAGCVAAGGSGGRGERQRCFGGARGGG